MKIGIQIYTTISIVDLLINYFAKIIQKFLNNFENLLILKADQDFVSEANLEISEVLKEIILSYVYLNQKVQ